jgi:uncharacterized protein YwqG
MLEKLKNSLQPLLKNCYRITAKKMEFVADLAESTRFGGPAYAEEVTQTPVCATCNNPLSFIFQFKENPLTNQGELLQFFYCFECSPWGGKNETGQWLIRSFPSPEKDKFHPGASEISELQPCICKITEVKMLPDFETLEEKGHEAIRICEQIDKNDPWDVYEETCVAMGCETEPFSSVGGYQIWIQGHTEKLCPECKKTMEFIAQIDSEAEADVMWGDAGCVYLFRCKEHPQQFAMEMQCF